MIFGGVPCERLAEEFGTPLWVIDEERIRSNYRRLKHALTANYREVRIYYAAKANTSLSVLGILRQEGACLDVASPCEVSAGLKVGYRPEQMSFTCPNVRNDELKFLLEKGVMINVDSLSEMERLLKLGVPEIISVRVNPGVGAGCHAYDVLGGEGSRFGLHKEDTLGAYEMAKRSGVGSFGIHMHIGSGILQIKPFIDAGENLMSVAREVHERVGINFAQIDFGGGIGIPYRPEERGVNLREFSDGVLGLFKRRIAGYDLGSPTFCMEPGRSIVGDAALLLTRVNTIKTASKNFLGVDAGFNTLVRPALYGAYHHIITTTKESDEEAHDVCEETYDVVGPLCEGSDFLAKDRKLPKAKEGDLLAVLDVGAYGYAMSSSYISRPRAPEVLVRGGKYELIREREEPNDLLNHQKIASWLE